MKTSIKQHEISVQLRKKPTVNIRLTIAAVLAICIAFCAVPGIAHGQTIYETSVADGSIGSGFIGVYDATTGAPINATLVSGLTYPSGIAVSEGKIFVVNTLIGTIGVYDAATGNPINAALVSGLSVPQGLVISGGNIFVTNSGSGTIGVYDENGAPIHATLVSGLTNPLGIAVSAGKIFVANGVAGGAVGEYDAATGAIISVALVPALIYPVGVAVYGGNLFVKNQANNISTIGLYDATTGATVNASLTGPAPGVFGGTGITMSGGNLFVTNSGNSTIDEYDATTGATVNVPFISGLNSPLGIAVVETVGVSSSPAGGGSVNGSGNYQSGSSVTVTATPATCYRFANWSENESVVSTSASYTFTVSSNRMLVANFALAYNAQVQPPINAAGTSVFNVTRGIVPVKFTLTLGCNPTCALPAATIALTRTAGGTIGSIDESVYVGSADTGSNFRIDSCQYVYNLNSSTLGVGTYRVDIKIGETVVGSATFGLK